MKKAIFKLQFKSGVHFGQGTLGSTGCTFRADTLYSALFMEAVKNQTDKSFYKMTKEGLLLFSDAFPYCKNELFLPKPVLKITSFAHNDVSERKKYKNLEYIPLSMWNSYLDGKADIDNIRTDFGIYRQNTRAAVRTGQETLPYQVAAFSFYEGCGLYFILMYEEENGYEMVLDLLDLLSYSGIGGKRSSGLGKFDAALAKENTSLSELFDKDEGQYMLLSGAYPKDGEAPGLLDGASYMLEKRSGFVASENYADEWRRKKDLYVFKAGSCFKNTFEGDIYDVSDKGRHPVYRYAKAMFIGI